MPYGEDPHYAAAVVAARAEIERLTNAIRRIDGINDNPADYNPAINAVCDAILREPQPLAPEGECKECGTPLAMGVHSDGCPHSGTQQWHSNHTAETVPHGTQRTRGTKRPHLEPKP